MYPPPNQGYPPTNQGYPPTNQGYPPPNQGYYPPNQGYYPPNQGYPPPKKEYYPPNQGYYPSPPPKKDFKDEAITGFATIGKVKAIFGVILGTIIGVALIVGGITALLHKPTFSSKTTGIVVDSNNKPININQCSKITTKDSSKYQCKFSLKYTVDNKTYIHPFNTDSYVNYSNRTGVTVFYDPKNPKNSVLEDDDYHGIGYLTIGIGIFILFISWLFLWITLRYKYFAAASGVVGSIQMIKHL